MSAPEKSQSVSRDRFRLGIHHPGGHEIAAGYLRFVRLYPVQSGVFQYRVRNSQIVAEQVG